MTALNAQSRMDLEEAYVVRASVAPSVHKIRKLSHISLLALSLMLGACSVLPRVTTEGKPARTISEILGKSLNEISLSSHKYFDDVAVNSLNESQLSRLLKNLEFETAEEAYARQVVSLMTQGCKSALHHTGPVEVGVEYVPDNQQYICLNKIDDRSGCEIWGRTTTVPAASTIVCSNVGPNRDTLELTPISYRLSGKKFPSLCILKARALIAHTKCLD